jgi:hypothetical protein
MEMNVNETKFITISYQPPTVDSKSDCTKLEIEDYLKYFRKC